MDVACGQCIGCRLDHSRMWAIRCVHEACEWEDNCFVTLTYRDKANCTPEQLNNGWHLPDDGSLNKAHFQKFMKRLRKRFSDRKVRYYHCGEYGDQLDRPHYHACLFNLQFPDKELLKQSEGNFLFTSQILEQLWPYGFATVGELTFQSAAYCARYVTKKVTGQLAHDHYMRFDEDGVCYWLQPEYTTMSRRPGIGANWLERFKEDCYPSDEVPVPGVGVVKKVPRYYDKLLERTDPVTLDKVKEARKAFKEENAEEYTASRLNQKYKVTNAKASMLKRGLL